MSFDRERLAAGELPVTRDGQEVLAIFDSCLDVKYPISAWIPGSDAPLGFTSEGLYYSDQIHNFDLVYPPKTRKVQVVVYKTPGNKVLAFTSDSYGEPEHCINSLRKNGAFFDIFEIEVEV